MDNLAPIVLFVYNRPWHTLQTLNALKLNAFASDSDLIIYSDGPKTPAAEGQVNEVRNLIAELDGFKSITLIARPENLGLAKSVIEGVTEVCRKFGRVIVLEDDLVTSPHFLRFMNEGLNFYATDERVVSIHGYVYPARGALPETFFMRGADCWGWATWERGWASFEPNGEKLLMALTSQKLERKFNINNSNDYMGMLRQQIAGKVNSWAIRWYASAFLANKLTLYPGISLVQNIGMDGSGTHCGDGDMAGFEGAVRDTPIRIGAAPVEEDEEALEIIEHFFLSVRVSFFKRVFNKVRSLAKKAFLPECDRCHGRNESI